MNVKDMMIETYEFLSQEDVHDYGTHILIKTDSTVDRRAFLSNLARDFNGTYKAISSTPIRSRTGCVEIGSIKVFIKPKRNPQQLLFAPSSFGLVGEKFDLNDYEKELVRAVPEKVANSEIGAFLVNMIYNASNSNPLSVNMFREPDFHQTFPLTTVSAQFSEVIGPLAIRHQELLPAGKVLFPKSTNAPLIDYMMIGEADFGVSAKDSSTKTSNCLSAKNVIDHLTDEKLTKWENSIEYQLLKIIADSTMTEYGLRSCRFLSKHFSEFEAASTAKTNQDLLGLIRDSSPKVSNPEENFILYYVDKMLVHLSKRSLNFSPIVYDSLKDSVMFLKFQMNLSESGARSNFSVMNEDYFLKTRMSFRAQNSTKIRKCKLGVQL